MKGDKWEEANCSESNCKKVLEVLSDVVSTTGHKGGMEESFRAQRLRGNIGNSVMVCTSPLAFYTLSRLGLRKLPSKFDDLEKFSNIF